MKTFFFSAERIDVWIGNEDNTEEPKDFEYIGFITLSNNENTKFKCRELKTISIPFSVPTKFVKLTLHQNHINNLNVYNQVNEPLSLKYLNRRIKKYSALLTL